MNLILIGAIAMACFMASLFFLRFWKTTGDRLFLFFALSFFIEGVSRIILGFMDGTDEHTPLVYLMRLVAFMLILFAITDKNRKNSKNENKS